MGCDIHAFAERRRGDKWVKLNEAFEHLDYSNKKVWTDEPYEGRDYELFAFLADVRNGNGIVPIATPKGVPDDASYGYLHEVERYGEDGHSHSFFTLKELKAIPKKLLNQTIEDQSLIVEKDESGKIIETCAMTNGKHYGKVGKRKLFKLFKDDYNPIKEIITQLESVTEDDGLDDEDIRIVFFFDN